MIDDKSHRHCECFRFIEFGSDFQLLVRSVGNVDGKFSVEELKDVGIDFAEHERRCNNFFLCHRRAALAIVRDIKYLFSNLQISISPSLITPWSRLSTARSRRKIKWKLSHETISSFFSSSFRPIHMAIIIILTVSKPLRTSTRHLPSLNVFCSSKFQHLVGASILIQEIKIESFAAAF